MKLSRESKYGLMGVVYLAAQPEGTVRHAGEIAAATGLAYPFLAKIFNRLVGGGILRSYRGRSRGYALARSAEAISVRAIVEAIEGPDLFQRCVFWSDACIDSHPCVMHELWRQIRPEMAALMERTSVAELARGGRSVTGGDPVRPISYRDGADRIREFAHRGGDSHHAAAGGDQGVPGNAS